MKKICFSVVGAISLCLGTLPQNLHASNVEYASIGKYLLALGYTTSPSTNATRLPVGSTIELGTFTSGFNFALNSTNYAATNAAFTLYDTTTIGVGTGATPTAGSFDKISQNLDSFAATGQQLYIWAFNSATPSAATAWAIVTDPTLATWKVPAVGTTFNTIDTSDVGTAIVMGARGTFIADSAALDGSGLSIRVGAVPEPSTYTISLLGALCIITLIKRSRRAATM